MQPFRKLVVWQNAHGLALNLYKITKTFPTDERYGLTSQIRRSAASICANIAEGCGRQLAAILPALHTLRWGQQANWNTTYSWLQISDSWTTNATCPWKGQRPR